MLGKLIQQSETGKCLVIGTIMADRLIIKQQKISVNELLAGERLQEVDYKKKAEENMVNLVKDAQENKKKILLSAMYGWLAIIAALPLFIISGLAQIDTWMRIV